VPPTLRVPWPDHRGGLPRGPQAHASGTVRERARSRPHPPPPSRGRDQLVFPAAVAAMITTMVPTRSAAPSAEAVAQAAGPAHRPGPGSRPGKARSALAPQWPTLKSNAGSPDAARGASRQHVVVRRPTRVVVLRHGYGRSRAFARAQCGVDVRYLPPQVPAPGERRSAGGPGPSNARHAAALRIAARCSCRRGPTASHAATAAARGFAGTIGSPVRPDISAQDCAPHRVPLIEKTEGPHWGPFFVPKCVADFSMVLSPPPIRGLFCQHHPALTGC
jgi:hypothetical protein